MTSKPEEEETERLKKPDYSDVTFDDILGVVGEFGRQQRFVYLLFCVPYLFSSMQLLGWVFVGAKIDHRLV